MATRRERIEKKPCPLAEAGLLTRDGAGLEDELQPQLGNTVRLAQGIDVRRAGQCGRAAAGQSEIVIALAGGSDRRGSGCRVAWVLEVGVIKDIEELSTELHAEAFRELDVLGQPRIEVPEVWPLGEIASASD